jgi:uncharacterized protein YegL
MNNNSQIQIDTKNVNKPYPLISLQFALDVSRSMESENPKRIDILNQTLAELPGVISNSDGDFLVSLTTFGNDEAKIIQGFKNPNELVIPKLQANGNTPLGAAVDLQMRMFLALEEKADDCQTDLCRPIFVFLTDGAPTGGWTEAAERLLEWQKLGKSGKPQVVVFFGVIEGCPIDVVSRFVSKPNEQIIPLSSENIGSFLVMTSKLSASMSNVGSAALISEELRKTIPGVSEAKKKANQLPPRAQQKHIRGSQRDNFSSEEQDRLLKVDKFLTEDFMK